MHTGIDRAWSYRYLHGISVFDCSCRRCNGGVIQRKFFGFRTAVGCHRIRHDQRDLHGNGGFNRFGCFDGELRRDFGDILAGHHWPIRAFLGNLRSAHGGRRQRKRLLSVAKRPRGSGWSERVSQQ